MGVGDIGGVNRFGAGVAAAVCVAVGITVGGCTAPQVDTSACEKAPDAVLEAIADRVDVTGELRFGQTMTSSQPDTMFVSAEVLQPDEETGNIFTWAASEPDNGRYLSVDTHAKGKSSWPAADFDVREQGAIESRACTAKVRDAGGDTDVDCPAGTPQQFCDRAG